MQLTKATSVETRFWVRVVKTDDCWLWTGPIRGGYGLFKVNGRQVAVHRWSYEHFVGLITDGLQIDHLCRVRHCVNPEHLEPVTQQENIRRGDHYGRNLTHCLRGHEFSPDNTYHDRYGKRYCRECRRERQRTWRAGRTE